MRRILFTIWFLLVMQPVAFADSEKVKLPDCLSGKQRRFLITINTKILSKDELLGILYQASGPNHPSYIAPESGPSFMGAGWDTMYVGIKEASIPKDFKLSRSQFAKAAEAEVSEILNQKGVESVSCY